mmetsp:Transcript_17624/g.36379  ORF Transcript_17624/g.36379 Transcript_17624/m.36379 type:complete len:503 (-) Transcript_17624:211-1719(-)
MNWSCSIASILSALGLVGLVGVGYHHYRPSFLNRLVGEDAEWPTKEWHETWHKSMGDRWMCKQKCAGDEECMSKCPKPWIQMEETCNHGFDIIRCHQSCGDDMNCHRTCPLPKCPKMAAKVKGIIQCNVDCGSDDTCRDACNAPVRSFRQMCGRLSMSGNCHKTCGRDRVCHKQCPKVFEAKTFGAKPDFAGVQPPPAKMLAWKFRSCQASCAGDDDCIEKCPKPFWLGFKKTCHEVAPIMECHRNCGHDDECHKECPLPSCPRMKAMVEATNKCHERCGSDQECHYHCPTPLMDLQMRCQAFEEAQRCHEACTEGDCHHLCPKAELWKFFHHGHNHGFHDGFHHDKGVHHDHHHGFHAFHGHHGHWHHFHHEQDPATLFLRGSQLQEQVITCTQKCKSDMGCLEKCTESWWELNKSCAEVEPIMECHHKCHHDSACHRSCPTPSMPWLKEKVVASMTCHHECGSDFDCHRQCKCPFGEMKQKCSLLGSNAGDWKKPVAVAV